MNPFDILGLALVAVFAIRCFMRGIVREVLSAAAFVLSGLATFIFWRPFGLILAARLNIGIWSGVLAGALIFLGTFLLVLCIERATSESVAALNLGGLDRFLGLLLGALEGLLIAGFILALCSYQNVFDLGPALSSSLLYRLLAPFIGSARSFAHV